MVLCLSSQVGFPRDIKKYLGVPPWKKGRETDLRL